MATPTAVSKVPATVKAEMGSANRVHAMHAVTGGTKYIKLVTVDAAPR